MENTIIAWTNHTFNAWMGCTKVSEGCRNCYAATLTKDRMGLDLWGDTKPRQTTKSPWQNVQLWNKMAEQAGKPAKVFCGSLMDWAEDRDDLVDVRNRMWQVIKSSRWLTFQMLTKRPENMKRFLPSDWGASGYSNVWLGTTIEDNRVAHRAAYLIENPSVVHFVSYEPAIGPLDQLDLKHIEWVIYGGESGVNHRKEDKQWARDMHKKCSDSGVAFFHKQSAGIRTEMGIELDGKMVREYPR